MRRNISEADIQRVILAYLQHRRDVVAWRQNSGSFVAPAIRAVAALLDKFGMSSKKMAFMAALKRTLGSYKCTSMSGLPDITVVYRGMYVGLEVKTKTGRLTKDQKATHTLFEKKGVHHFVVRSLDDAKRALESIDKIVDRKSNE